MSQFNRRNLILAGVGIPMLTGLSHSPLRAQPLGANPFTLGVASGDPWPDGFVIWTRLAPRPLDERGGMPAVRVPVRWEVSENDSFTRVVRQGEAVARPEMGHSVHVEVEGLKPYRRYWYRFAVAGSDLSNVGTAVTAPLAGETVQRLRIGIGGCNHYAQGFYDAWEHLSREPDLDLVFHYGDYIYEGGGAVAPTAGQGAAPARQHFGGEIYSLDDYRRRYAQYKSDPGLIAVHAASAFACSFDDHEVDNNWAGAYDQDGTPPEVFMLRRFAALQAWYENMPVRRAQFPTLAGVKAYRRLDYGRLLRMHVLDTRSYRDDQPCDDRFRGNACPPEARSANMLGQAQETWLDEGLGHETNWNLLAQQVIMMPLDFRSETGGGEGLFATDLWDGYRPARQRLIDTLRRRRLTNVVVASGDNHRHGAGEIPVDDRALDGEKAAVEFLASSISSGGNGEGEKKTASLMPDNPHWQMYTDRRGYQLFDITPREWVTSVKVIDKVSEPGGIMSTLGVYAAEPHQAKLHKL